jgi:hypothetical protein
MRNSEVAHSRGNAQMRNQTTHDFAQALRHVSGRLVRKNLVLSAEATQIGDQKMSVATLGQASLQSLH